MSVNHALSTLAGRPQFELNEKESKRNERRLSDFGFYRTGPWNYLAVNTLYSSRQGKNDPENQ